MNLPRSSILKKLTPNALFAGIFIICLFAILATINSISSNIKLRNDSTIRFADMTGVYKLERISEEFPFRSFSDIHLNPGTIRITGSLHEEIPQGAEINLLINRIDATIEVDGDPLYSTSHSEIIRWDTIRSPGLTPNNVLTITLKPLSRTSSQWAVSQFLNNFCYGSKQDLLLRQLDSNSAKLFLSIFSLVVGLSLIFVTVILKILRTHLFRGFFSCGCLLVVSAICILINYDYITLLFKNAVLVNAIDSVVQLLICLCMLVYLNTYLTDKRFQTISFLFAIGWAVFTLVYFSFQLSLGFSRRGTNTLYALIIVILFSIEITMLALDYRDSRKRGIWFVMLSTVILLVSIMIEIVHLAYAGYFILIFFEVGLLLFTLVQVAILVFHSQENFKSIAHTHELERQLEREKSTIMLSQIKPQFLYNSLESIKALCEKDASKAAGAIEDFEAYLLANMDSLEAKSVIPIELELNHVRCFMNIQQLRYGDNLRVRYEIQDTDFLLPPLSILTAVEDSIEKGLAPKSGMGTLTIKTQKSAHHHYVIIEDDGVGFNMEQAVKQKIAPASFAKVRSRIEFFCHGSVSIASLEGKGTKVVFRIPIEEKDPADMETAAKVVASLSK